MEALLQAVDSELESRAAAQEQPQSQNDDYSHLWHPDDPFDFDAFHSYNGQSQPWTFLDGLDSGTSYDNTYIPDSQLAGTKRSLIPTTPENLYTKRPRNLSPPHLAPTISVLDLTVSDSKDVKPLSKGPKPRGRPRGSTKAPAAPTSAASAPVAVKRKAWSNSEIDNLLEGMLGTDQDKRFKKLTLAANRVWKTVAADGLCPGRDAGQMQHKFTTMLGIFKSLHAFRNFTGGGADADDYDWDNEEGVTTHLQNSQNLGCDVAHLNATVCKLWHDRGWYELFRNRYDNNPKVVRTTPRSSADAVSDAEVEDIKATNVVEIDDDDDSEIVSTTAPLYAKVSQEARPITPARVGSVTVKREALTPLHTASSSVTPATASSSRTKHSSKANPQSGAKDDRYGLGKYFDIKAEVEQRNADRADKRERFKALSDAFPRMQEILANAENYPHEIVTQAQAMVSTYIQQAINF
ncbi:hypothetical protein GGX14DRAFT_574565 [Mycena pura]|uniref:Uncharacterized protein n=1 Tax=Mycena pura TaxID=153505 RepID=A0AAD6UXF9_9AGAR|nr:hypothetical protein GGX14DRAFT_574565 [Mycena pura]